MDRDAIIKTIRNDDSLSRFQNIVTSDELHSHLESKQSSLFIDIEQLKETEHSVHIPEILENRASEIRRIWVNETLRGKYDLRYLWLTAYGFEILRALKVRLIIEPSDFLRVKHAFSKLGFNLQVHDDNIYPKIEISDELKSFVWDLVLKL
ncbi:MAG: hypothetical protein E4H14_07295 [Candidatus Thorarchaeota archaeon]|nr:MAG: hypothetical protein E4H14_07295 [Candidatus Thorarchaeota archaeon]